jgi:hypothetical protein
MNNLDALAVSSKEFFIVKYKVIVRIRLVFLQKVLNFSDAVIHVKIYDVKEVAIFSVIFLRFVNKVVEANSPFLYLVFKLVLVH